MIFNKYILLAYLFEVVLPSRVGICMPERLLYDRKIFCPPNLC